MPEPKQKLFSYDGTLKTVEFISEGLAAATCTETTYVCRDENGRVFRCSKDMYCETEHEAMHRYLDELLEAAPQLQKQKQELLEQIRHVGREVARVSGILLVPRGGITHVGSP